MPSLIPTPEGGNTSQEVALGGITYTFKYTFNSTDERWRLDILLSGEPLISGMKVMETTDPLATVKFDVSLTGKYDIPDFNHGELFCFNIKSTSEPVGIDNLGISKDYTITYLTNEEIQEIKDA